MKNFSRLEMGMSYREVVEILGKDGTELSRNNIGGFETVLYEWDGKGWGGGGMNAMFQNGKLIQKSQLGLD